jgi:hypothetical protein
VARIQDAVEAFRRTVSPNLLSQDDFIDWHQIDGNLKDAEVGAAHLQRLVDQGNINVSALAEELESHPAIYGVILSLIAFHGSSSQVSKWGMDPDAPRSATKARQLADQLIYVGLERILENKPNIRQLLRIAEVYKDGLRRRFRSGKKLEVRIDNVVRQAVRSAANDTGLEIKLDSSLLTDYQLRRSVEYVIAVEKRAVAAIVTVFQNQSGGRQQRDLSITYPLLQERLSSVGVALILIADGQGLKEASEKTLTMLFESVRFPMSIDQAMGGHLQSAIADVCKSPPVVSVDQAALNRIIVDILNTRNSVSADDLPLTRNHAILVLARFVETNKHLALKLSVGSDAVSWLRPNLVQAARNLAVAFDTSKALDLFAEMLGSKESRVTTEGTARHSLQIIEDDALFTDRMLVSASRSGLTADLAKAIGIRAMQDCPGSSVAFLLLPQGLSKHELEAHRKKQAVFTVNIVVVGASDLIAMAKASAPRRRLVNIVLDQSNLTKASPFVLSNATPQRMFYGRDAEAATIKQNLGTNSIAILGSRRIGKTSLLRRLYADLKEAGFQPFFGDCQTVKTWKDFAVLAKSEWQVNVPTAFAPHHLADVVAQLGSSSDGQVVILLDEIDRLLEWDRQQTADSVPEAFFRACRSLSQDGRAQFVFSGERTIASRLWDPHSPHWNFCRPVQLRQLTREAASALLVQPLQSMNIRIGEPTVFAREAWHRTSGHPQIVQHLGDRLVRLLDTRTDRTTLVLDAEEILAVTETYEFAEHYLHTYWGQATELERAISLIVAEKPVSASELEGRLAEEGLHQEGDISEALRMLNLYGVIEESDEGFALRAKWFPEALSHYGGVAAVASRMAKRGATE